METNTEELIQRLDGAELVVADSNKFKIKLGIGEDAYASLKLKGVLQTIWDVKEAGAAGATAAASPLVATTFFGGGGLLSSLGLGAAAVTPVGWIIAAAVASGGAYYGATRLLSGYASSRVETIPKFINTPIDLLGATIFDMMAGLALKVSEFSGSVDDTERDAIVEYFNDVWGISPDYAWRALPLIELQLPTTTLKEMVRKLGEQQLDNPDCNPAAMQKSIRQFLEEIAHADGSFDEREELAIDTVERELGAILSTTSQLSRSASQYAVLASNAAQAGGSALASGAKSAFGALRSQLGGLLGKQKE